MAGPDGRRRIPFRVRLTAATTVLCVGVLALAGGAITLGAAHALQTNLDRALLSIARAEIASAIDEPDGSVHVHEEEPLPLHLPIGSGYEKFAQIRDANGRIIAQTTNLRGGPPFSMDPKAEERARTGQVTFADLRRAGREYRAVYYPLRDARRRPLLALIALPKELLQQEMRLLLAVLAGALVLGACVAGCGADYQARRLTHPLEVIAAAAREVGESSLSTRIPEGTGDVELQDVAAVLNAMLGRLEQSFQAQKQLIAAQRRFVADASHELRSPLGNLRGTVEVSLRRPRSPEEYHEALVTARGEIERLCRLVEDLLTLSRADAGQFVLDFSPGDLARVAVEAAASHAVRAEASGVRLRVEADRAVRVCADQDRLRQVVDNLLDNALRYAPRGSEVTVRAWIEEAEGPLPGEARLSVRDCGPGIAPEDQERIFDRFYRADRSRARHSGGLGLGLAIARAIVDAHHGRLDVESQPGTGTTFTLRLHAIGGVDVESSQSGEGSQPVSCVRQSNQELR